MKLQPLNLEELADEIIRMEYPTYEQTTIPQIKNSIIRKKQQIKFILEQRVKSAVQGYLRYYDRPDKLWNERIDYIKSIKKDKELWKFIEKLNKNRCIILRQYNSWLFHLVFKSVLGDDKKNGEGF